MQETVTAKKHVALRGLLWLIALYHIGCGAIVNICPDQIPAIAEKLAGMKVNAVPEFVYLAKPFGVYAIVFGVMMGVAAWNPIKNRALVSIGIILFGLRIIQRFTGMEEAERVFGVSYSKSLMTIGAVACFGAALIWLRIRLYREMHHKQP